MLKNKDVERPTTESELIDQYIEGLEKKEKQTRTKKYRPRFKRRPRFLLPTALILAGALVIFAGLFFLGVIKLPQDWFISQPTTSETAEVSSKPTAETSQPATETDPVTSDTESGDSTATGESNRPSKLFGAKVTLGTDYTLAAPTETTQTTFTQLVTDAEANGLTTLFLDLNAEIGLISDQADTKTALEQAIATAHEKAISVFGVIDLTKLTAGDITTADAKTLLAEKLRAAAALKDLDGLMLSGAKRTPDATDFRTYMATGTPVGYKQFSEDTLTALIRDLSAELRAENGALLLGLICDSIYATDTYKTGGIAVTAEHQMLRDDHADVLKWMQAQYFDIVFVNADTTTSSKDRPFEKVVNWWSQNTPPVCDLGFMLSSDLSMQGEGEWKNPDQLTRQLMTLNDINRYVFCFNSYAALKNDTSGGAKLVYKYLTGGVAEDYVLRELSFTSPTKRTFTTYENSIAIIGASDPNFDLLLNGEAVERTEYGYFTLQLDLKVGKNTFTFSHKGSTTTFNITYRYVILKDYSPSSAVSLNGGDTLIVKATARTGSTVSATLNGQTAALQPAETEEFSDFTTYTGSLTMPAASEKDVSLGKIKFSGTHNGVTESFNGGTVTIKKKEVVSSEAPPATGGYIGVGNTLIAEVTKYQAETFDGDNAADDRSLATNNFLPAGTLDYCGENTDYDPSSGKSYRLMRYGKRVYTSDVRTLRGSLPESNQLSSKSVQTEGSHTILTLKTAWKAPFKLQILPQSYTGGGSKNRTTISSRTFTYVDITFSYASELNINIEELLKSPIFSNAQVISNTADKTLRLYLKKAGEFYGWTAEYDSEGNLVFRFVNPVKASADGRLDNIKIVVDAGHGGSDGGAGGNNPTYDEAALNLVLAQKVAAKLEARGATVVMTRTSNTGMTNDERIQKVRNARPNLAISIHRDSAANKSANGYSTFYFNPYTHQAAEKVHNSVVSAGLWSNNRGLKGHVFFLSRVSDCPVVLTENGFVSNGTDYSNMLNDDWNEKCADAIVKGIVEYFQTIGS